VCSRVIIKPAPDQGRDSRAETSGKGMQSIGSAAHGILRQIADQGFLWGQSGGEAKRFQGPPDDYPRQRGVQGKTEATQPHPAQACNDQRSAAPAVTQVS